MKSSVRILVFVLVAAVAGLPGCYYDNFDELHPEVLLNAGNCDTTGTIRYTSDILPVFNSSCGANNSCHDASASSGINLGKYTDARTAALNGILWSAVTWDGKAIPMPQGSSARINDCYQGKIKKWIDDGALDN